MDDVKKYPEMAKLPSDDSGTEHETDLNTACGSDHHNYMTPETTSDLKAPLGKRMIARVGGCHNGSAE